MESSSSLDLKDFVKGDGATNPATASSNTSKSEGRGGWQAARSKAEILEHPLYELLLSAHVACLRISISVNQLPRIDAQLGQSQNVVSKYSALGGPIRDDNKQKLDHFMHVLRPLLFSPLGGISGSTSKEFQVLRIISCCCVLSKSNCSNTSTSMPWRLAVMACWEIEKSLQSLTGVSPGEGTGTTMSDNDDDQVNSVATLFDGRLDGTDTLGFGPLISMDSERLLMEQVRHELKHELKQGYKEKILDIREEILRKQRAGKLHGDTTSVLKAWWQLHSKLPCPTEEDKVRLVQETGLQLKQINNWFINQRKRNWHSNPSSSTVLKSKRKR